ncbi:MmgE/PrpD family protein [Caballeronia udeis]|uniref:MmgE/PrpD family protein n=1 Tax=Caballeronia udeis TaxID=1232866 RepID=A0A158I4F5_9BURK|nr:MmgE/PrpD family protein [Caballeronia udeis]SAL51495.1 MmgE/PrpD family protein [Caballeronia udeis]
MAQQKNDIAPMMRALSEYVASAIERPLPAAVVEKAKHHILDTFAAIVVGASLKPGQVGMAFVESQGGKPECTIGITGKKTSLVNAAFANGMLAGAGETDDSHYLARMHPGCAIVPPILAVSEQRDRRGEAFLRAVVLGYDIGCRLTMSLDEALLDGAFHSPHSFGGLFGGTAGCSALLGFDAEHVRYAFSFAVQQAAGVTCWMRDPEHVEKAFVFGGNPARNAAAAAAMVHSGFTGGSDPFHGQHNFFDSFSPQPNRDEMVRGLGTDYEIMRAMIKKWTVGSPIQAAIDSAQILRREHNLKPSDIESVIATLPDKETKIISNRHMPEICLQHLISLMLVDGDVTLESSHDYARMNDPVVLGIRERLTVVPDAEMTRTPPPRQARIEIITKDGRHLSHHTGAVRGTPDNPMERGEVEEKAMKLMAPRIGEGKARAIVDVTWNLEQHTVRELFTLFSK